MKIIVHRMERHATKLYEQGTFVYEQNVTITVQAEVVLENQVSFLAEFTFPGVKDISFSKAAELVQEHLKHGIA
ncbi:hypothetical protein [Bacillus sp. FSL K6-1106]|uniref:hypothetical protein n=1 Tax=Bacillus sp. FSL K6-1106 TaxID=2921461 RepID=UPI0030FCAE55